MNPPTDFSHISSPEQLREEKRRIGQQMGQAAARIQDTLSRAFLPNDRSLLHSPVGTVRYASYAVTAYKTVRSVRRWIKFFRGKGH